MAAQRAVYPRLAGEPVGIPSLQGGEDVKEPLFSGCEKYCDGYLSAFLGLIFYRLPETTGSRQLRIPIIKCHQNLAS
jgi:hypothetical protein